jgi:CheY-like chemotaxis protein
MGSSFWIELMSFVAPDRSRPAGQGVHIFYAEDDAANQQAVAAALAELGRVSVASDGQVALARLLSDPADLLLLDLDLPGLSGQELLAQLRRHPHTEHLPVVLLTAGMSAEVTAAAANCQGLLRKPLDMKELHDLVEALLSEVMEDAE